jgi:hypothetical protein
MSVIGLGFERRNYDYESPWLGRVEFCCHELLANRPRDTLYVIALLYVGNFPV